MTMNEINAARMPVVQIKDGGVYADSRDVAAYFGKRHTEVIRAIRDLVVKEPNLERRNFASFKINDLTGESTSHYEMDRDGFALLAMGFTGEKALRFKLAYIQQFNAMEASLRQAPLPDLSDPVLLVQLLTEHASKRIEAEKRADAAERAVEAVKPTLEAHDRIAAADGSLNITEAAKALQVRPKELFDFLAHNGWTYKRPGAANWLGYQTHTSNGDLEHKVTTVLRPDGSEKVAEQVRITPKGLTKLAKLMPSRLLTVA